MAPFIQGAVATAPAGGRVDVTATFDPGQIYQDCTFMPRGATNPSIGDRCVVAVDDQGDAWLLAWEPA